MVNSIMLIQNNFISLVTCFVIWTFLLKNTIKLHYIEVFHNTDTSSTRYLLFRTMFIIFWWMTKNNRFNSYVHNNTSLFRRNRGLFVSNVQCSHKTFYLISRSTVYVLRYVGDFSAIKYNQNSIVIFYTYYFRDGAIMF